MGVDKDEEMSIHPPFTPPENLWEYNEGLPAEHQVVKIGGYIYDDLVTMRVLGIPKNDVPWVILFANKDNIDCKRSMF